MALIRSNSLQRLEKGTYTGENAQVVQSYTEANVKHGSQFEASTSLTIASGASSSVLFTTGAVPVIIKGGTIRTSGSSLTSRLFRDAAGTGGTPVLAFNMNDYLNIPSTVTVLGGVTVTTVGTLAGAPRYGLAGSNPVSSGAAAVEGLERVLRPNTTYRLELTNTGQNSASFVAYYTWFEGVPDFPTNEDYE